MAKPRRAPAKKPAPRPKPARRKPAATPAAPLAPAEPLRVIEQKQAAALLGVTDRGLRGWELESWWRPEFRTRDGYAIEAIREAQQAHGKKGSDLGDHSKRIRLASDAERLKQRQIETRDKTLRLRMREGDLIPRVSLEQFAASLLTGIGDWSDQEPDLVASECCKACKPKVRARLKSDLAEKRRELAAALENHARKLDADKPAESRDDTLKESHG